MMQAWSQKEWALAYVIARWADMLEQPVVECLRRFPDFSFVRRETKGEVWIEAQWKVGAHPYTLVSSSLGQTPSRAELGGAFLALARQALIGDEHHRAFASGAR